MNKNVYQFDRHTIDRERGLSFSRGSNVCTNDEVWISKFGRSVTFVREAGEDEAMLTVLAHEKKAEAVAKKPPVNAKPRVSKKPKVVKAATKPFGEDKSMEAEDTDRK